MLAQLGYLLENGIEYQQLMKEGEKKWLEDKISTLKTILSLTSGGIYSANAYNDDACRTGSLACVAQS